MDLGGRAASSAPLEVGFDVIQVPLLDKQALGLQLLTTLEYVALDVVFGVFGVFFSSFFLSFSITPGPFEFEHSACGGRSRSVGGVDNGHEQRR